MGYVIIEKMEKEKIYWLTVRWKIIQNRNEIETKYDIASSVNIGAEYDKGVKKLFKRKENHCADYGDGDSGI